MNFMMNKVKKIFDLVVAASLLLIFSPLLFIFIGLIYFQDFKSPFYVAERVGKGHHRFNMIKLRSMIANADKNGVDSTSNTDNRITGVGRVIRQYKIDELMQLVNVLICDMSIVGPRPNVNREVALYTREEDKLLSVKPGITDLASIVFSDEGDILSDKPDPDIAYNQLIRPGKSMLGIFYIEHRSISMDVQICILTALALISKNTALKGVVKLLKNSGASEELISIASRKEKLIPMPPPGSDEIVISR